MMRGLIFLAALILGQAAEAAPVVVSSGEHPGFTRLVFDYGASVDWRFGRSTDGYEIALNGAAPTYDLRGVFQPIGTTRLAAIWPDPNTGNLHIGIACACHAMPFEFRPGVLVVDLRDGPPPRGSSFEATLDGSVAGTLSPRPPPRPKARPSQAWGDYDWLAQTIGDLPKPPLPGEAAAPARDDAYGLDLARQLEPLRQQLLTQLSRGAAQGIVDLTRSAGPQSGLPANFSSAQIVIGGNRGSLSEAEAPPASALGATGNSCIPSEKLEVAGWGTEAPVAEQWSAAMAGLVGEFDQPDAAALERAVHFNLFLGFGAEARQMLRAFGTELGDADVLAAMSYIVDDEAGDVAIFKNQTACDGTAALWSALTETGALPKTANLAAIRLAFSDLPPQLRDVLGPRLAQRFLDGGDTESARAIRDAILRKQSGHSETDAPIAVLDAAISDEIGDPDAAEANLRRIARENGNGAVQALAALVDLRARRGLAVQPEDVEALEASANEWGGDKADGLSAAILLGKAASGDPGGAFAMLPEHPTLEPEVWNLLARLGTDRQVLELAILPDQSAPDAGADSAARLAGRLLDLGFAEPAERWLAGAPEQPMLQARIDLARARPQDALALLAGRAEPEATQLQLSALGQLGDDRRAASLLAGIGEKDAAQSALNRATAWPELAKDGDSPLQKLAAVAVAPAAQTSPEAKEADGQLARSHTLVSASEETRALIGNLLGDQPAS